MRSTCHVTPHRQLHGAGQSGRKTERQSAEPDRSVLIGSARVALARTEGGAIDTALVIELG